VSSGGAAMINVSRLPGRLRNAETKEVDKTTSRKKSNDDNTLKKLFVEDGEDEEEVQLIEPHFLPIIIVAIVVTSC